ncbi:MAG: ATP-dependent helicase [Desulfamplus sp.]|nr:ATP-dependent helicase [Desulfamplus sp.]
MKNIKVAIASDFLSSFAKIPKKQQSKVLEFINKFRTNPMASSINYEKINKARDKNMRSVRIDLTYRGIVLKPDSGNVYVLLWVDHHDNAYKWALNKLYKIHPETGSLQVIDIKEQEPEREHKPGKEQEFGREQEPGKEQEYEREQKPENEWNSEKEQKADVTENHNGKPLFYGFKEEELIKIGVPEALLAKVNHIKTKKELDTYSDMLPEEVYEALFFLSEGYSLEDVVKEMELDKTKKSVDVEDFATALDNPDSKRRFHVVEDEVELMEILSEPLEKWRVFLHPSQRNLVERKWNGPVRVLGGAGTGKTVVAMHRAKWLAEKIFNNENDRVLFTTYTTNLAADINSNLKKICSRDVMRRIEVVNLDKWISTFLKRNGYKFEIDYFNKSKELWKQAVDMATDEMELPESFYREEWDKIIQPQGITNLKEYIKASRVGRGVRLNRKDRKLIWPVFEEYRILLNENNLKESDDAMQDARILLEKNPEILPYKSIVVDEAQDMSAQAFMLLSQISRKGENSLFIVGDAHQRIYPHRVVLSHCGINIVGRSKRLKINYRTTDETRSWAVSLLKGIKIDDLDGGEDSVTGYKSLLHGKYPEVHSFKTFNDEIEFLSAYIKKHDEEEQKNICLVARINSYLDEYEKAFKEKGLEVCKIKRTEADDRKNKGVRLATMHRVKGIEFDQVLIAGVNDGIIPFKGKTSDKIIERDRETSERSLLYVSATRAKKNVIVTGYGNLSRFVVDVNKINL